jgi:putative solute:sodium symporter small subunit
MMHPTESFDRQAYWRRTLRRVLILLAVWFVAGPLMAILFVEELNRFSLGGIPFGFWMAQQGAIYVFVILIFLNAWLADRTDHEFDVHETAGTTQHVRQAAAEGDA